MMTHATTIHAGVTFPRALRLAEHLNRFADECGTGSRYAVTQAPVLGLFDIVRRTADKEAS